MNSFKYLNIWPKTKTDKEVIKIVHSIIELLETEPNRFYMGGKDAYGHFYDRETKYKFWISTAGDEYSHLDDPIKDFYLGWILGRKLRIAIKKWKNIELLNEYSDRFIKSETSSGIDKNKKLFYHILENDDEVKEKFDDFIKLYNERRTFYSLSFPYENK